MGYKLNQFFLGAHLPALTQAGPQACPSTGLTRRASKRLHSCGDIRPFIPELVEIGVDALNPLEVKAGVDPIAVKQTYGDRLVLHGGINAVLWDDMVAIEAEMRRVIPFVKANGGYIFSSDHSVPSAVSLDNFRTIVNLAKTLGSYD